MKGISFVLFAILLLFFAGCTGKPRVPTESSLELEDIPEENVEEVSKEEILTELDSVILENNVSVEVSDDNSSYEVSKDGVSVKTDSNGNLVVNTSDEISEKLDSLKDVDIDIWCISGNVLENKMPDGTSVKFEMQGSEVFKDKLYCKSDGVVSMGPMNIETVMYANSDGSDLWILMEVGGQLVEQHMLNGEVVQ